MSNETSNQAPRNPFAGTGIVVKGLVRTFGSKQGKDGSLYHDLYLTTAANSEVKISLLGPPDPARFVIGSLVNILVRLAPWQKESRSGMVLKEVAA